jgi:hydrogenase/urease accessory protein HupE
MRGRPGPSPARVERTEARFVALVCVLLSAGPITGHEVRPALLELVETAPERFDVLWKVPVLSGRMPPIRPVLPEACSTAATSQVEVVPGARLERFSVACIGSGLGGGTIAIESLDLTLVDVLVRIERLDGAVVSALLRPDSAWLELGAERERDGIALAGYLRLGVDHILLGVDHLLFVFALLLLVDGARRLIETITAFTVAHSVTLALATFGVVHAPPRAVEAVIALSIVFLAAELARKGRGVPGLTERRPWVVSFSFGLLHGLGFAGALAAVGLPEGEIPLALLLFNAGVELGQLLFVGVALVLLAALRHLLVPPDWARALPALAIGVLASYWFFERFALIFA